VGGTWLDTVDSIMKYFALMDKKLHTVCKLCTKEVGTKNFNRHADKQHTDKNIPAIIVKKLKHNERRKIIRKELYTNDNTDNKTSSFKVKTKPLTAKDLAFFFRARSSASSKLKHNQHHREERCTNDAAGEKNAEEKDNEICVFQVKTKPLTAKDIAFFFRPRGVRQVICDIARGCGCVAKLEIE
jgi:hypothetical protein